MHNYDELESSRSCVIRTYTKHKPLTSKICMWRWLQLHNQHKVDWQKAHTCTQLHAALGAVHTEVSQGTSQAGLGLRHHMRACSDLVKCCATHPAEPLGRLWTLVEMPSKVSYSNQLPVEHRSIPASLHYIASLGTHIVKSLAIAECKDATPNTYLRSTARGHFTCLPVDCASASATLAQSTIMAACNHWFLNYTYHTQGWQTHTPSPRRPQQEMSDVLVWSYWWASERAECILGVRALCCGQLSEWWTGDRPPLSRLLSEHGVCKLATFECRLFPSSLSHSEA